MKNFKVEDRIQIRSWEDMEKEFGVDYDGDITCNCTFTKKMKHLCGEKGIIIEIYDENKVEIVFDNGHKFDCIFNFSTDMIELQTLENLYKNDFVYIKPWEELKYEYRNPELKKYCGRVFKLEEKIDLFNCYKLRDLENNIINFDFYENCLVKIEEENIKQLLSLEKNLVVEYEDGRKRLVMGDDLIGLDGHSNLANFDLELKHSMSCLNIKKIYKISNLTSFNRIFNNGDCLNLIWERKKKTRLV